MINEFIGLLRGISGYWLLTSPGLQGQAL